MMKMPDLHVRRCWCTDQVSDERCVKTATDNNYLWFKEAKKAHAEAQKLQRLCFLAEQWRLQRYEKDAPGAGERAFILRLSDAEEDLAEELIMLRDHPHE